MWQGWLGLWLGLILFPPLQGSWVLKPCRNGGRGGQLAFLLPAWVKAIAVSNSRSRPFSVCKTQCSCTRATGHSQAWSLLPEPSCSPVGVGVGAVAGREFTFGCGCWKVHVVKGNLGLHFDSAVRRAQALEPHRAPSLATFSLCASVSFL